MRLLPGPLKIIVYTFCFCFTSSIASAQTFDYERRPAFDFQFSEAKINVQVNPVEGSISGAVTYNLQANINNADTLELDAAGIEIDSVLSQGKSVNFTTGDDRLLIALADSSHIGQQYQVQIFYRAIPQFGLLKSSESTLWTSMLPRSNRHWLPVKDHPRAHMVTTLSLQIPATARVFASGVKTDEQVLSTDAKKVTFRSSRSIPITSLSFGLGSLRERGTSMGIKRVNLYAEAGTISESEQSNLLNNAKQIVGNIEQATGQEYPYQQVHLVVLKDHYWEQKPYGASVIYLYENRGDWVSQLRRGLYAQWFGVFRHETQWSDSRPVQLLQAALHYDLEGTEALLSENVDEPAQSFTTTYENFSAGYWNFLLQSEFWSESNHLQLAERLTKNILNQESPLITTESFTDLWYRLSGQPTVDLPSFGKSGRQVTAAGADSIQYRVNYILNEQSNTLRLAFVAQQGRIQQPVTVPVKIISRGGANTSEISFSGSKDTATVSIPTGTQNVELEMPEGRKLFFEEHKPVSYLLYQLRNAETAEVRKKAAVQLGYHTENPDLQLALSDLMKKDMDPKVEAALLRSYGAITDGAEGTEQRFLDALENENSEIRAVALSALGNYTGQKVTQRLRTFSQNEANDNLSNRALKIYLGRIDSTAALEFTNTLVQQDTAGTKAIVAISALAESGNTSQAVKLANFYIEPVYAYPVRKQAFQILLNHDNSAEAWKKRAMNLINDVDPRIRFLTVKNVSEIPGVNVNEIIQSRLEQEYDARVYGVISNKQ